MKQIVILEAEEGVEYPFTTLKTAVQFLCDNYKALNLREDSEVTLWNGNSRSNSYIPAAILHSK